MEDILANYCGFVSKSVSEGFGEQLLNFAAQKNFQVKEQEINNYGNMLIQNLRKDDINSKLHFLTIYAK